MTRKGLRSEAPSDREDPSSRSPHAPSPTLSGEESSMEDQPNLKQIMDLVTQLQNQVQTQQAQMQLELANIKAALTGAPLREEQPVTIQPLVGEKQHTPAETNESVVDSHTESATFGLIRPGVSDEGRQTMDEKIRKWVNRVSVLSYADVKDKSAADLHKRLDKLGDEFVRHTGKLTTDNVFTLDLMSRESEKIKIARGFRAVLGLENNTDQILSMKIDTLKNLLRKKFPDISIADIIKFARSLPGEIHFPKRAEGYLKSL